MSQVSKKAFMTNGRYFNNSRCMYSEIDINNQKVCQNLLPVGVFLKPR